MDKSNKPTLKLKTTLTKQQTLKISSFKQDNSNDKTQTKHQPKELSNSNTKIEKPVNNNKQDNAADKKKKKPQSVSPEKLKKVIKFLNQNYPDIFPSNDKQPIPLAVGIHKQILAIPNIKFSNKEIRIFLKIYTSKKNYKKLLTLGSNRFNLDGSISSQVNEFEVDNDKYKQFKLQQKQLNENIDN